MKKNKKVLLASVLATGFVFGGAMALNANVASAASNFDDINFTNVVMSEGAAVRVSADVNDTNYGIRFQMNMDQTTYNTLEERGANYGIAIFPADYNYEISESAIFAVGSKATLVTSETLSDANKDGTYDMWGSLVNIKPANVTREFVGIGYVELNGEYKLANAYGGDIENNTRSIYYVAQLAVDKNDKHADIAKETYIDTFDTAGKQYAYTVEHVYKKDGEVVKTDKTTEYGTLNTKVSATAKTDVFYKAENATVESTLYANGNTKLTLVYNDNTVAAKYNAAYVKVSGGKITLDATKFDVQLAGLEAVYVDGAQVAVEALSATQISVPVTAGEHEIAVYDGEKWYVGEVIVADYEVANKDNLLTWQQNRSTYVYAVVTADFDCANKEYGVWDQNWTGTLNGLGHTISNSYFPGGFPRNGKMRPGAALKNINFAGMQLDDGVYSIFGAYMEGGLVENVTMTGVTFKNFNWTNDWAGLLGYMPTGEGKDKFTMRNVTIEYSLKEADRDRAIKLYSDANAYYGTNFENVTIISNGRIAKPGETDHKGIVAITLTNSTWKNVNIYDRDDMEVLTSSEKGVLMTDGKITLDTTKFAKSVNIDEVIVGGVSVDYTLSGNTLTVPVSTYGPIDILLVDSTANKMYTLAVTVADYLISTQKDFKEWGLRAKEGKKYLILTKDIVCDGSVLTSWDGVFDNAILDGMGYTVTNANYSYGLFTAVQPNSATIKNINFENMKLTGDAGYYSMLGTFIKGAVFENVNISATYEVSPNGLIFGALGNPNPIVFRNCTFDITVPDADTNKSIALYNDDNGAYKTTMENVTIIANCKIANVNHSTDSWKNVNIYDKDDMTALTTSEKYALLTNGNATLDMTKFSQNVTVASVMVNGVNIAYSVADNKLTFATAAGVQNLVIIDATANKMYAMDVKVADVAIGSRDELRTFWRSDALATAKYVVITQSFDAGSIAGNQATEIDNGGYTKAVSSGFVLDGLGNTVSNWGTRRGLFYHNPNGVTVRDITFDALHSNENAFGLFGYYIADLTLINVTVNVNVDTMIANNKKVLGNSDATAMPLTLNNCTFNLTCSEANKDYVLKIGESYYPATFNDVTINYNGTMDDMSGYSNWSMTNVTVVDKTGTKTYGA